MNKIEVPNELKELANLFPKNKPLFLVGGFVRDSLLSFFSNDFDICSALTPDEVRTLLEGTSFNVKPVNLRVGTILIEKNNLQFEFTTFRKDNYPTNGTHSPVEVQFVDSIEEDAKRRDFKINAIYFDIINSKIIDPLGGIDDLKNKSVSAVVDPETVFSADGLRLLRLARVACELGFNIEPKTFKSAKNNRFKLKDISSERILAELKRIFVADTKFASKSVSNAHINGLKMLDELGILEILLPELTNLKGLQQRKDFHNYDAFEHSLKAFEFAVPNCRVPALLHDIGKKPCVQQNGTMHGHAEVGASLANQRLKQLNFSKIEIEKYTRLIKIHMFNLKNDAKDSTIRKFVVENQDLIEDFFALQIADAKASKGEIAKHTLRVQKIFQEMKKDGTPFSTKDLLVKGDFLIEQGIKPSDRATILNQLLSCVVTDKNLRTEASQKQFIKRRTKS